VRHSQRRDLLARKHRSLQTLDKEFEVVIAGGGIAGLTAALVSARLGRKTLVLTGNVLGGLLLSIEKIEGFPGYADGIPGYELCPIIQEQAIAAGVEFAMTDLRHLEAQGDRWYAKTGEGVVQARALILATGSTLKELGVPGETRLRGKGVSYCASCDAPLLRNRTVAVVGGGDSALQESLTLADFAERVIVLARGEKLSAQMVYRNRVAEHPKIEIRFSTVVEQVLGADKVTGARIRGTAGVAAADLELAALFVYIGLQPNTAFLKALMRLDPSGRITVNDQMRTELRGVFAAGVVRSGSAGRAVASAGDGTTAAVAADRFLVDGDW
jgi:thioredoxin reductase (NADPH)